MVSAPTAALLQDARELGGLLFGSGFLHDEFDGLQLAFPERAYFFPILGIEGRLLE
jgi:hypothetical protein